MRAILSAGCVLAVALLSARADDKKGEKIDGKLLVGKWKQYEPAKGAQLTSEFTADGKFTSWIDLGDGKKPEPIGGTYKVVGNKIVSVLKVGNLTVMDEVLISKLTKEEFHTVKQGTLKMKRVQPDKK